MTSPIITGVDFVAVPTNDFDASIRFYGETLGLPCIGRYGDLPGAEFQAGNLTLAIMQPDAFGQEFRPNCMPIALQVDDVAAARAQLEAAGIEFVTETFDSGVCHQAIFQRPGGQPARSAPPLRPTHAQAGQLKRLRANRDRCVGDARQDASTRVHRGY